MNSTPKRERPFDRTISSLQRWLKYAQYLHRDEGRWRREGGEAGGEDVTNIVKYDMTETMPPASPSHPMPHQAPHPHSTKKDITRIKYSFYASGFISFNVCCSWCSCCYEPRWHTHTETHVFGFLLNSQLTHTHTHQALLYSKWEDILALSVSLYCTLIIIIFDWRLLFHCIHRFTSSSYSPFCRLLVHWIYSREQFRSIESDKQMCVCVCVCVMRVLSAYTKHAVYEIRIHWFSHQLFMRVFKMPHWIKSGMD